MGVGAGSCLIRRTDAGLVQQVLNLGLVKQDAPLIQFVAVDEASVCVPEEGSAADSQSRGEGFGFGETADANADLSAGRFGCS